MKKHLSHLDETGAARMVDIGGKGITRRTAKAGGELHMSAAAFRLLRDGAAKKGDVIAVARVAAIAAVKRAADLIPLCHPLPLDHAEANFFFGDDNVADGNVVDDNIGDGNVADDNVGDDNVGNDNIGDGNTGGNKVLRCEVAVRLSAKTGAEMEALTGVCAGLLTAYDMLKAADKTMTITNIRLITKTGGKTNIHP